MKKLGLKGACLFLMGKGLEFKKYALSHLTRLLVNPQKQYLWALTSSSNKESVLHGPLMRIYQPQRGAQRRSGTSHRWIRTECLQKRGL